MNNNGLFQDPMESKSPSAKEGKDKYDKINLLFTNIFHSSNKHSDMNDLTVRYLIF